MQPNSRAAGAKEAAHALKMFPASVGRGKLSPFNKRIRELVRINLARSAAIQGKRVVDLL